MAVLVAADFGGILILLLTLENVVVVCTKGDNLEAEVLSVEIAVLGSGAFVRTCDVKEML
jgi:hypothetical protein